MRFIYIGTGTHHDHVREMPARRMGTRGRPRAVEAQDVNEDQPQLATITEIVELRQVVQQQAEML